MTVAVAYKVARNPEAAKVQDDGEIDWSNSRPTISDDDAVAMRVASDLAAELGTQAVALTVGGAIAGTGAIRKNALAKGPDRALIVAEDATAEWSSTTVGQALALLAQRAGDVNLLITGPGSIDEGARVVPALIAAHLGWPCFQDISSVRKEGEALIITQELPGERRTLKLTGPAVLAVTSDAAEVSMPGMRDILSAGKKPFEVVASEELDLSFTGATPVARRRPEEKDRKHIVFSGAQAEAQLADALVADGVIGGSK